MTKPAPAKTKTPRTKSATLAAVPKSATKPKPKKKFSTADRTSLQKKVTTMIVDALKKAQREGTKLPFTPEWDKDGRMIAGALPVNAHTMQPFKGINIMILQTAAWLAGYSSGLWMTYPQAEIYGAQVRKGEKSTRVVRYKVKTIEDEDDEEPVNIPVLIPSAPEFNIHQMDDLPEHLAATITGPAPRLPVPELEAFFQNIGAKIITYKERKEGFEAHYNKAQDTITMPPRHTFPEIEGYYATLCHELAHWTMEKNRLNRRYSMAMVTEMASISDRQEATKAAYAIEELVAELTVCYVGAELGFAPPPRRKSLAYLQSWIMALENDPKVIFRVASLASEAARYLIDRGNGVSANTMALAA